MMKHDKGQKGVALYLSVIVMAVLLSVSLGISLLLVNQIQIQRGVGHSVVAFAAAQAGLDRVVYLTINGVGGPSGSTNCIVLEGDERLDCVQGYLDNINFPVELENGASYSITLTSNSEETCDADNFCARSTGTFQDSSRRIHINY